MLSTIGTAMAVYNTPVITAATTPPATNHRRQRRVRQQPVHQRLAVDCDGQLRRYGGLGEHRSQLERLERELPPPHLDPMQLEQVLEQIAAVEPFGGEVDRQRRRGLAVARERDRAAAGPRPYMNPYLAGIGLGVSLGWRLGSSTGKRSSYSSPFRKISSLVPRPR